MGTMDEIIKELKKGLLYWYNFAPNSRILQISENQDALTELLEERGQQVERVSSSEIVQGKISTDTRQIYDYVVMNCAVETCDEPELLLLKCRELLKWEGVMLLGMNNRFGLRYFCGDRDPYTNRSFDGIENYQKAKYSDGDREGRCYNRAEMERLLNDAGFDSRRFYSVLPDCNSPQLIYAEDYLPKEELAMRYFPMYHSPDTIFLEEERLYTDLIKNGMFHAMANAYLVECTLQEKMSNVNQVTISIDRGKENALLTIIRRDNKVEKRPVYKEGAIRLKQLMKNGEELQKHGIKVVEAELEQGNYVMPYEDAQLASNYLRNLIHYDVNAFITEMDRFRQLIISSSEIVEQEDDGFILKHGYFDMVPHNCFFKNGEYYFYDQEFCIDNYPANVMITRLVEFIYLGDVSIEEILPKEFFLERYGLTTKIDRWRSMAEEFLRKLRNENELRTFHEQYRRNYQNIHTNRQRLNYSENEYERLFLNIFDGLERKKLILFGSGRFAKKFVELYGSEYSVSTIVDNNPKKWGICLCDIKIQSPEILKELDREEYKVIICIKNYLGVMKQLKDLGVKHLGIYDVNKSYRHHMKTEQKHICDNSVEAKRFHIGYIAGVFDLFHVGHLNMFKRAKEQCDYLIVGVVSDEGVRKHKKVEPFIPFSERIEMVRSCRYVDEAVEIPLNYGGTRDAYRLYHFDVQFSGSDYVDNPDWLADREFLRKHGSDMVFFPYTEQTSSTKIKALIEQKLS